MKINFCQFENYREQALTEQMAWHTANAKRKLNPSEITAFAAGFNDGWRQLMTSLKLHAGIKIN